MNENIKYAMECQERLLKSISVVYASISDDYRSILDNIRNKSNILLNNYKNSILFGEYYSPETWNLIGDRMLADLYIIRNSGNVDQEAINSILLNIRRFINNTYPDNSQKNISGFNK